MSGSIEIPFAVGERAWWAGPAYETIRETCPDCAGKGIVLMVLGNGEEYFLACERCRLGYNPSRGHIETTRCGYRAREILLEELTYFDQGKARYRAAEGIVDSEELFKTEAEATARGEELRAERQKQEDDRVLHQGRAARRNMASSVSYWRQQVARRREELEAAERYLGIIKVKK